MSQVMSWYNNNNQIGFEDISTYTEGTDCSCRNCYPGYISQRTIVRIIFGARQAIYDLEKEAEQLEAEHLELSHLETGSAMHNSYLQYAYPYNWMSPNQQEINQKTLLGARSVLHIIHDMLCEGMIPDTESIKDLCSKATEVYPYTTEYFSCGGSVSHILIELTQQVESDLRGEALYVDSEELVNALENYPACRQDNKLDNWKARLQID